MCSGPWAGGRPHSPSGTTITATLGVLAVLVGGSAPRAGRGHTGLHRCPHGRPRAPSGAAGSQERHPLPLPRSGPWALLSTPTSASVTPACRPVPELLGHLSSHSWVTSAVAGKGPTTSVTPPAPAQGCQLGSPFWPALGCRGQGPAFGDTHRAGQQAPHPQGCHTVVTSTPWLKGQPSAGKRHRH